MAAELVDVRVDERVGEFADLLGGCSYVWGGTNLPMPIGAVGEQLAVLGTGPGAICYLDAVDVASLDVDERIAYLQAWER